MIGSDGVLIMEERQDCSVIRVFVVCSDWCGASVISVEHVEKETEDTALWRSCVGNDGVRYGISCDLLLKTLWIKWMI